VPHVADRTRLSCLILSVSGHPRIVPLSFLRLAQPDRLIASCPTCPQDCLLLSRRRTPAPFCI